MTELAAMPDTQLAKITDDQLATLINIASNVLTKEIVITGFDFDAQDLLREAARRLAAPKGDVKWRKNACPKCGSQELDGVGDRYVAHWTCRKCRHSWSDEYRYSTAVSEATGANVNPQRSDDVADLISSEVATERSKLRVEGSGENRNTPATCEHGYAF